MIRFPATSNHFARNFAVCLLVGLLLCAGCSIFKSGNDAAGHLASEVASSLKGNRDKGESEASQTIAGNGVTDPGQSDQPEVKLDGSLSLGSADLLAFTPTELVSVLEQVLSNAKIASARELVSTYPDIVSQILIDDQVANLSQANRGQLVDIYQRKWGTGEASYERLKRALQSGDSHEFFTQRNQFRKLLGTNLPKQALALKLSEHAAGNEIFMAESQHLEGVAHLMLGNFDTSAKLLDSAVNQLKPIQPVEAARLELLLGEVHRRAGDTAAWKQDWQSAVEIQSRLMVTEKLADPAFWKQAAFLRPMSESWPAPVIDRMKQILVARGLPFDDRATPESVVWATIGCQSLDRHESQNAILSFKKSESTVSETEMKKSLQMQQAIAMIEGGQAGPASAILLTLSSQSGLMADRAKAILATLKLQNGSLAQGMNLLQSAIKTSGEWPLAERLRAQADFGLAYLMRGREQQGVQLLNQLHDEFVKAGDYKQASQCLSNIATYYDKTEQTSKYKDAMKRLEQFESQ